jgi:hypothetical protein
MKSPHQHHWSAGLPFLIVFLGCLLRLVWLDADPDYHVWIGYITDEGRWVENLRSLFLDESLVLAYDNIHLLLAPLFHTVNYLFFLVLDLDRWSARLFTALCGSAIVVLFFFSLRRHVGVPALALGVTMVAFQEDLVMLSRVCVPEMPALFLGFAAFILLVQGSSRYATVSAGFFVSAGLAMKATLAPILPLLGIIALFRNDRLRGPMRTLVYFSTPVVACGVVGAFAAIALAPGSAANLNGALAKNVTTIAKFVELNTVYNTISFFFYSTLAPTINVWLLGVWVGALVWLAAPEAFTPAVRRWLCAALVWAIGFAVPALTLHYFPDRYKVQILLPLALLVTFSANGLQTIGLRDLSQRLGSLSGGPRLLFAALMGLPWAVLIAPMLVGLVAYVGLDIDVNRVLVKLLCMATLWLILALLLHRASSVWIMPLLVVAVVAAIVWLGGHRLFGWPFWPTTADPFLPWSAVALAIGAALWWPLKGSAMKRVDFLIVATAIVYACVSAIPYGAALVHPEFTLREVSEQLGKTLGDGPVASYRADGLFLDNDVRYESHYRLSWRDSLPPFVVKLEDLKWDTRYGGRANEAINSCYRPLESYWIHVSSRYPEPVIVTVYGLLTSPEAKAPRGAGTHTFLLGETPEIDQ